MVSVGLEGFLEPGVYVWESGIFDPLNVYCVLVALLEESLGRPSHLRLTLYFLMNVAVWVNLSVYLCLVDYAYGPDQVNGRCPKQAVPLHGIGLPFLQLLALLMMQTRVRWNEQSLLKPVLSWSSAF